MLPQQEKKHRLTKRARPKLHFLTPRNISSAPEECITNDQKTPVLAISTRSAPSLQLGLYSGLKPHNRSLPIVKETTAQFLETPPVQNYEPEKLTGPKDDRFRLCVKKWKRRSPTEEPRTFKAIECFRRAVRIVRTIIRIRKVFTSESAMFFGNGICKMMEEYMSTNERPAEVDAHETNDQATVSPLSFDPKVFKADKEVKISKEVETILSLRPEERTADQLRTSRVLFRQQQQCENFQVESVVFCNHVLLPQVMYALQTLVSFAELPLHMQEAVCKVAWLQSISRNKIIIKQGHLPERFYFIISGTVTVMSENDPTTNSLYTSLATLKRGSSFGETAFLRNTCRTATVFSKDPVQLLVIDKEDYLTVFMGRTKNGEEAAHIKFCRSVDVFADWPVDILINNNNDCMFQYFRRGTVIVRDSNDSDWLYIIVSGVCEVLMRLESAKPKLRGKSLDGHLAACVDELSGLTENRHRKSKYAICRRHSADQTDACSRKDGSLNEKKQRRKTLPPVFPITPTRRPLYQKPTTFVQIDVLHPRNVFGLSSVSSDYDSSDVYPASASLVSRGAECVMISKNFFTSHASDLTKKWIRHNVRPYPSRRTLQKNLQDKVNWIAYRHDVVQSVVLARVEKSVKHRAWKHS